MQRTLAFCLLLPLAGAAFAAPPAASDSAQSAATDAAAEQQMAQLQTRMNDLARQMAALSTKLGDEANASALHYLADSRRGMFGMAVMSTDKGLRVDAVTPGGPAERAGIKAGDTITRIDGKPVGKHGGASGSALWHAQAGKPIVLAVDRGGKLHELRVTPERLQTSDWQDIARQAELAADRATAQVRSPEFQRQIQQSIDEAMKNAAVAMKDASVAREAAIEAGERANRWTIQMSPWFGLNLAPLNPDLGSYFGTDRGALVLSRDDKQFPELQPGDVITAVGGQPVARPEDATRALREAGKDKSVAVALRRHGKPVTLAMKVPIHRDIPPPPPPPPPVPPVRPTPPPVPPVRPTPPSVTPPAPPPSPTPPSHA
ncbi:MAG: PDZ domain-containing protein [Xanthomonadaceae bacterium]|nr:PDZ domain-containing protein [Xanthomonadaceae bacterium]